MISPGIAVIVLFLILALFRVPIFIALGFPALVHAVFVMDQSLVFASQRMLRTIDSFTLLAIPLFIYVGTLMNHGEITERIFEFADDVVGHLTGGLAQVNIFTSLVFSGISGSALADIGGVGKVLIETMMNDGYSDHYSSALTSAAATVGPLFPPSIPLILVGIIAEISVLQLLLAGIGPALLTVLFLMAGTYVIAHRNNFPKNPKRSGIKKMARSFIIAFPALFTPVVLIYGMLSGIFGPTEAAAVTVAYIILINTGAYRITEFIYIWDAAVEAARTTGVIAIILAAAGLFAWVLSVERVSQDVADVLFAISTTPSVVLFLVIILLLLMGLFLDPIAAIVMVTPVIFPILTDLGYDPIHIGVVTVYALMIGLITPPLGLSVYLSADISGADVAEVFRASIPYYFVLIAGLIVVAYVPSISLFILEFN